MAPAGAKAKVRANLAALDVLAALRDEARPATAGEQAVLARWSGWGATPGLFDDRNDEWAALRGEVRARLDEPAWAAARRTTLNAHYTPVEVVEAMWTALRDLGFDGGRVLEPGCGAGNFIGLAPAGLPVRMVGVEPSVHEQQGEREGVVASPLDELPHRLARKAAAARWLPSRPARSARGVGTASRARRGRVPPRKSPPTR